MIVGLPIIRYYPLVDLSVSLDVPTPNTFSAELFVFSIPLALGAAILATFLYIKRKEDLALYVSLIVILLEMVSAISFANLIPLFHAFATIWSF
jgi:hypothetical protein